jgi:hypothetical protein
MNELENTQCQWIGDADYNVLRPTCCRASIKNRSYCEDHIWLVYQKGTAVKPRKRATRSQLSLEAIVDDFNRAVEDLTFEGVID